MVWAFICSSFSGRTFGRAIVLALHPAGGVSLYQSIDLGNRHPVEITGNGLLERAGRHGEPQRRFGIPPGHWAVDKAGGEPVPPANPIADPHVVALAVKELLVDVIPQRGAPSIVAGRHAFAQ